jgi:hypothetical protein
MRGILLGTLALFFLTGADPELPTVVIQPTYMTVPNYREMPESLQQLYVVGVLDGLFASVVLGASEAATKALSTCLAGVTSSQLAAMVNKYVSDHPEQWQLGAFAMVHLELLAFCPAMGEAARHYRLRRK